MIVKAISHTSTKKSSIEKLIKYVFNPEKMKSREERELIVKHFVRGYDKSKWADAFKKNDVVRTFEHSKRTVLRHEIISFAPQSSKHLTREKLKTLAKYYLKHRSPRSMGVATVHYDKSPHIHFIISGVSIEGKSTRISRREFKAFKIKLQEFQQDKYPELSHSVVQHSKKKSLNLKLTFQEQRMKNKGVLSEKEKLSKLVMQIASSCKNLNELASKLEKKSLEPYYRNGKLTGLWFGNRKFRLTTLGIGKEHLKLLTQEQLRLDELQNNRNKKNKDLEQ